VIARWLWKGNTILRMIRQTHPKTVSLNSIISLTFSSRMLSRDTWKETTCWVTRDFIRANIFLKPVLMMKNTYLHPIPLLVIHSTSFTTYMVTHVSCSHKITFVSGINKHFAFIGFPIYCSDGANHAIFLCYPFVSI